MDMKEKYDLSIVILTYNVRDLLSDCLKSVLKSKPKTAKWQIIVVDNHSNDDTVSYIKNKFPGVEVIVNNSNIGFAAGNNIALPGVDSRYVLFLNPDTVVVEQAIYKTWKFMEQTPDAGAVTCRVELPDGRMDYSCHRGIPTVWNSICYFSGLAKIFPKIKLFSGYTSTYQDLTKTHVMECGTGTFFMVRKEAGDVVGWWNEDYYWNGEDVEFCFDLREKGWKVYFYPEVKIVHYKSSSSGLWSTAKISVPLETKIKSAESASKAMKIFFHKHYLKKYPKLATWLVEWGIDMLGKRRISRLKKGLKYE